MINIVSKQNTFEAIQYFPNNEYCIDRLKEAFSYLKNFDIYLATKDDNGDIVRDSKHLTISFIKDGEKVEKFLPIYSYIIKISDNDVDILNPNEISKLYYECISIE